MPQKTLFSTIALSMLTAGVHAETCYECSPRPMRVTLRHIEANGIGYNQGYTTLEGFFAPFEPWKEAWLPFLDVRGHIFNNGKPAANAGLGLRYITDANVFGCNVYYDYRKTSRLHYNQVSVGLEALGKILDFRINGYLPVGRKASSFYDARFSHFDHNYLKLTRKQEFALKGANAEIGAHVDNIENFPFYFAAGPYYLEGKGKVAWGGQVRATVDLYDYVRLEGNTSYDNVFKWIGQGQISLIIPFGRRHPAFKKDNSCSTAIALSKRSLQRVDRFEIIPVDKHRRTTRALDPLTGKPYFFWFVDNTSHSSGTYESPFTTLTAAQDASSPNDVIYVLPGDGTSTGLNFGITLQDNQKLFGASIAQTLPTTMGTIRIPAFASQLPLLTNVNGTVVTVGNNNVVSGLYIQNYNGDGIGSSGINNLIASNNIIQGDNNFNGITLNSVTGNVTLSGNIINNEFFGITIGGAGVSNATYSLSNNTLTSTGGGSSPIDLHFTDFSNTTCTISGNTIESGPSGISASLSNSTVNTSNSLAIENNSVLSAGDRIDLSLNNNAVASISILDNFLNGSDGVDIFFSGNSNSQTNLLIANNLMPSYNESLSLQLNGQSIATIDITNNTFISENSNAVNIRLGSTAALSGSFTNNKLTAYLSNPVFILTGGDSSTSSLAISHNTLIGGSNGIEVDLSTSAQSSISILNNNFNSQNTYGIFLNTSNSSQGTWTVSGNTITAYVTNAANINSGDTSITCLKLVSNTAIPYPQAFSLNQSGSAVFNLEPPVSNVGQIVTSGTINPIPAGGCEEGPI